MLNRFGMNRNLSVMCGTIFLNVFFVFTWNPLLPLYLRQLGANDWEIGVSFTLMSIARTLFAVIGGALADRYGRKKLIVLPQAVMLVLYLISGMAGNWVLLLAIFVATNALNALTGPAFMALIAESSSEERVAQSYSLSEFAVLAALIAGPIAGAALIGVFPISTLITLYGVVLIGSTFLRAWGLQETRHRIADSSIPQVRAVIDANVRWCIVMGTLVAMAFSITFGPYFAILSRDAWHNSEAEINLLFAAGNVAAIGGLFLGRLSDRWGAHRVFIIGMLGYGVSAMAWGIAPMWQWGLVPLLIAFGFSEAAFIAQSTLQAEITTRETRTSVFGIITTVTGVIGGLGPSLGAWLITRGGNSMPFVAAGIMALVAIAATLPIRTRRASISATQTVSVQAE